MSFSSEVAAAEYYIRSTMQGSTALAAFTSTIEPLPLPRGSALPAMGYSLIGASYVETLPGVRIYAKLTYRIVAIGLAETILTLAQIDSVAQGLFGYGREARVAFLTPYGTVNTVRALRPHSLAHQDPATNVLTRHIGASYLFEVQGL